MRRSSQLLAVVLPFLVACVAGQASAVVEGEPIVIPSPGNRGATYRKVDALQQLGWQIRLARAEVDAYRRILERYSSDGASPAFLVSREKAKLRLAAAEIRLQRLRRARLELQQWPSQPPAD